MNTNSVKQSVIDGYGKLAQSKKFGLFSQLFACCNPIDNSKAVAEKNGYSEADLQDVPDDANLGVGCGNPSALAQINPGDVVIDLGSGAGFDAFIVAKKVGDSGTVIGVDLSQDMLDLAQQNAKKSKFENVEFVKGDIEELPFEDNIADHIISNCVINLSQRKDKVYNEAYRVLKPGGQLSVSDIVLERELPDFVKKSLAGHIACVSGAEKLDEYLNYLKVAGFQDIKVESEKEFPLELMMTDPQVLKIAKEMDFNLSSDEAKDIASRVKSVSITASKK